MKQTVSNAPGSVESDADGATVPLWLIVLTAVLLYLGAIYFDEHGGWFDARIYTPYTSAVQLEEYVVRSDGPDISRGDRLFNTVCVTCHGSDGAGKPGQAPPLAGSEWVNAEGVNRLIRIPVLGLSDPIHVKGQLYTFAAPMVGLFPNGNRTMPGQTDKDLSDILSYIRQAWGNKAGLVTEAQVKAVRDDIGTRTKMLTVDELLKFPETQPK